MKEGKIRRCLQLGLVFLRIGAFTFGGGYAMIPLIRREAVEKRHWIEDGDVLDILAVAESTPGPIAVNAATYVGVRVAGIFGALAATLGVVLPSLVTIMLLSLILQQFEQLKAVQYAFMGIRAAVLALILHALATLFRQCPGGIFSYTVMGAGFLLAAFTPISVYWLIAGAAAAGLIRQLILCWRERRKTR